MAVRLLTSAMLGLLIVAGFYLYDYATTTDKLAVSRVEFNGLNRLSTEDAQRLVGDVLGQNILLVPLENYTARFTGHPRIRSAVFKRVLPDRVICTVEEREPVALVFADRFLEVDEGGMVLPADALTDMLDLPIITGLEAEVVREGQHVDDERVVSALATLGACKKYGGKFADNISEIRIDNNGISIVSLKEGMVLLVGESGYEGRLKKFFLMQNTIAKREESARLIDLRFDDQIVLRSQI